MGVLIVVCVGCGSTPAADAGPSPPDDAGPPGVDAGPGDDGGAIDGGSTDAGTPSDLERRDEAFDTGASGEIAVTVPVSGQRSFMVVASSDTNARLSVLAIEDPTGATVLRWEDWYDGPRNLTNAIFARRTATAVNWPVRDVDPPLMNGDYVVRIGSYRVDGVTSRPNVAVATSTLIARDADLTRGVVRVAIVWADGLAADAALVAATEAAVAHWRGVWSAVGVDLDVRYVESTIDPSLPYPAAMAGDFFLAASELVDEGEVPVVVGEIVDDNPTQYGAAGFLPGPIVRSPLSAIVVGWLAMEARRRSADWPVVAIPISPRKHGSR